MLKRWRFSTGDLRIQESSCSETVPQGVAKRYPPQVLSRGENGAASSGPDCPPLTEVFG